MKKKFSMMALLMMMVLIFALPVSAGAAKGGYKKAYRRIVKQNKKYGAFKLDYIDGDKVPELICGRSSNFRIYTYKNGKVRKYITDFNNSGEFIGGIGSNLGWSYIRRSGKFIQSIREVDWKRGKMDAYGMEFKLRGTKLVSTNKKIRNYNRYVLAGGNMSYAQIMKKLK
ncbi:MAG: hypothetical protein Q4B01_06440 [Eubacteriales bacterium]|nr:hypothetical protein [Eubacteriales bacterium]